jgi:heavy metal translocating P-type ATPase
MSSPAASLWQPHSDEAGSERAAGEAACHFCGLPVEGRGSADASLPVFCCFGCRFAAGVAQAKGEQGRSSWTLARLGVSIFFTLNVVMFSMVLWTRDVYAVAPEAVLDPARAIWEDFLRWLCLLLSVPVCVMLGGPLVEAGLRGLAERWVTSELFLAVGVAAALGASAASVLRAEGPIYFEVACVVLVAVTLGRWLEALGKEKAAQSLRRLERLLPEQVRLVGEAGETLVPLRDVRPSQVIRVLPGGRVPLDGQIEEGAAFIDEQIVTGETQPVLKSAGDSVTAGTLNHDGGLLIRVTASAEQGSLRRLVDIAVQAASRKGNEERTADRLAAWFLPATLAAAVGAFFFNWARGTAGDGLMAGLSTLLIACPCALGVATPMAVWAALGHAFRRGVLVRRFDAMSRLARIRTVCFDKTGTLTTGQASVEEVHLDPGTSKGQVLGVAAALARSSSHPLALGVARALLDEPERKVRSSRSLAGRGVRAEVEGLPAPAVLGSRDWLVELGMSPAGVEPFLSEAAGQGSPLVCVGWDGMIRGCFVLREEARPTAGKAVELLRREGLESAVLTGDHRLPAHLKAELGDVRVHTRLLPEDKQAAIGNVRRQQGSVAMVGDGINDAPALAFADVGISLGSAADVARDASDMCLLTGDLTLIPWVIDLARRTVRAIRVNLFWAVAYNVAAMALAVAGLLNPIAAAGAMLASSLFVIQGTLRLAAAPLSKGAAA